MAKTLAQQYPHYHKPVPADTIDVYRVLHAFEVTDPCIQHAIKKLLCAGGRGAKDTTKDVLEAMASLTRYQEMREEEAADTTYAAIMNTRRSSEKTK